MPEQDNLRVVIEGWLNGIGYDIDELKEKNDLRLFHIACNEAYAQGYADAERYYSCES